MSQNDVTQIRVGHTAVGIMGLKQVMEEMARDYDERPDEEVRDELLKRLSKRNYIPDRAKENYAKAFLREFKKFLGKPCESEVPDWIQIRVLGPGCPQCDGLEQEVMQVLAEMRLSADIIHVRDVTEIGKYGVMGMPALIINGEVKSVGRIPPKFKLLEWLTDAKKSF